MGGSGHFVVQRVATRPRSRECHHAAGDTQSGLLQMRDVLLRRASSGETESAGSPANRADIHLRTRTQLVLKTFQRSGQNQQHEGDHEQPESIRAQYRYRH